MIDLNKFQLSYFPTVFEKCEKDITLDEYVKFVRYGTTRETVEKCRAIKADKDRYKKIKAKLPAVTGSCTIEIGATHILQNLNDVNGLMVIDIDEDLTKDIVERLKKDKYTTVLHKSVSGSGVCIFVQIQSNKDRFKVTFEELAEYYNDKYDVIIDPACKNVNRLRYISWDEDIFINLDAARYTTKKRKETPTPQVVDFVYLKSDFDDIVSQITSRRLAICNSYQEYLQVGFALANEFGESGRSYFKAIASCSAKYKDSHADKQYNHCLRADAGGGSGKVTIATVYYYAKQAGCKLYSERTKEIVRSVSICKNSNHNAASTKEVLRMKGMELTEDEEKLADDVFNSKKNLLKEVSGDESDIEKLVNFITEKYDLHYNDIKNLLYCKDKVITDNEVNDMYIEASKLFFGDFTVKKTDIANILSSSVIQRYNPIAEFFDIDVDDIKTGYIKEYAKLLPYRSDEQLEYNTWILTHYLVGAIHNWISSPYDMEVCPFCLVIAGKQGNGKSSFIRYMLPDALRREYFMEERIDGTNKDSKIKMGQFLLLSDEEFGGMANKDAKAFKALADLRVINERQAYRANAETWKRRAILAGTTNEMEVLKDFSGNRRILPIDTFSGNLDYDKIIEFDNTALLHEAYLLYKNGYQWRIFKEDDQMFLKANSKEFEASEPFGDVFFNTFSIEKNEYYTTPSHMRLGQIMEWFGRFTTMKPSKYDILNMFKNVNINKTELVKMNGRVFRGYKLYVRELEQKNAPF